MEIQSGRHSLDTAASDKLILDDPIPPVPILFLATAPNLFGADSTSRFFPYFPRLQRQFIHASSRYAWEGNAHPSQGDDLLSQFDDPIAVSLAMNSE